MPTLAAVLVYAGWGTIHPSEIMAVARAGVIPAIAMMATFGSVMVLPVAQAVGVGVVASLLHGCGAYARALAGGRRAELHLSGIDPDLAARWQQDRFAAQLAGVEIVPATPLIGESTEHAVELGTSHRVDPATPEPIDPTDGVSPGS